MITCTRRIQFCAGHRVVNHESKCRNFHGHNYVALITAQAGGLDAVGRVIDFSVLKEHYGRWIDVWWDHGMILWENDPLASIITEARDRGNYMKFMLLPTNPTAENMAEYLLKLGPSLLKGTNVVVTKVRIWETENCYADSILQEDA